jgi:hypothetical protein
VTLQGSDPNNLPLTYSGVAETQPYYFKSTYGLYEDSGGYYTNARGSGEKYLRGTVSSQGYTVSGGPWYYILPTGDFYEFTPSPDYVHLQLTGVFLAHLGAAVYNDPSLLWNAQNIAVPTTLSVASNVLTITPSASYSGTFEVIASVSNGTYSASQPFAVTVQPNLTVSPPSLAPVPNQTVTSGHSIAVTLQGSDPNNLPLTYSAVAETQPYYFKSTYGLYEDSGGYYANARGFAEKYLRGTVSSQGYTVAGGPWYYLLPTGDFYEFTPSPDYVHMPLTGVFLAHLGAAVYNDPSQLWNAQNTAVPTTLSVSNNVLTITPSASYTGTFEVVASVTNGTFSASQPFAVTVQASTAQPPSLAPISDKTIPVGGSLTLTLQGTDPNGLSLTYSAVAETQPYWLESTFGLYEDSGGYYANARGSGEKYLRGTVSSQGYTVAGGPWYYILPNGEFYEFTPSPDYVHMPLNGVFLAHLGVAVYNDPSLLWNAQNIAVPVTLSVSGNQLTITPNPSYSGIFVVIATASDGLLSASQAFKVTVS